MKTILAIVIIGMLIAFALWLGYNGTLLAGGVAVIAGLGGYQAREMKLKKETRDEDQNNQEQKNHTNTPLS